jgi:hypothetical protein
MGRQTIIITGASDGIGELRATYPRIDALANNAGGIMGDREVTKDGFEKTFQVNHLAPFLLTYLLMPALLQSRAKVLQTSSVAAKGYGRLNIDDQLPDLDRDPQTRFGAALDALALAAVADGGGLVTLKGWTGPSERGVVIHPISSFRSAADTALLESLCSQAENGVLTLRVADVLPAAKAPEAHRRLAAGGIRGRLVLDFTQPQW